MFAYTIILRRATSLVQEMIWKLIQEIRTCSYPFTKVEQIHTFEMHNFFGGYKFLHKSKL